MKKVILQLAAILASGSIANAQLGDDGDRSIVCTDKTTGAVILNFPSLQNQAEMSMPDYNLTVTARGDEVGQVMVTDKRNGTSLVAIRFEEYVSVKLKAATAEAAIVRNAFTHKGYAEALVSNTTSGDQAVVKSLSRKGQSQIDADLSNSKNQVPSINIVCKKI